MRNTIVKSCKGYSAFRVLGSKSTVTLALENCTLYDNHTGVTSIPLHDHKQPFLFFSNTSGSLPLPSGPAGQTSVIADFPQAERVGSGVGNLWNLVDDFFVNAVTGDFHLVEGAPVIDQGTTLASVPDDYDGVRRPQGSAYDIGGV